MAPRVVPLQPSRFVRQLSQAPISKSAASRRFAPTSSDTSFCKELSRARAYSSLGPKDIVDGPDNETSSLAAPGPSEAQIKSYDPIARAHARKVPLPSSRFKFRPPRYYRGPLHPHQPPPNTNPAARDFVPGPFSLPRYLQTYNDVIAADLMTLLYEHTPPGTPTVPKGPRLREWDGSSPYHKNRPLRAPRGRPNLPLLRKPITFRNIPTLSRITVHALVREAPSNSAHLHVAGMILQALSGQRAQVHVAKKSATKGQGSNFTQKVRKPISVSVQIQGEQMWHFFSTFSNFILPRIKDWDGWKARAGDKSGNLQLGLTPEVVGLWPEVSVNFDAYPQHMIPGVDVILHTTAAEDRDARMLLSALGVPFASGGTR